MPISREIVEKETRPEYKQELQAKLERCMSNDLWANKIFKDMAILIVTYPGQRAYLKACVESHAKLGYFMALTYDRPDDLTQMPQDEVMDAVDLFLMPHKQSWGDTDYPFFWGLKWGSSALQQFDKVYCINGDFVLDRPEKFDEILSLMGDADFMGCGPDYENFLANGAFIIKSKFFYPMVKYMQDTYIPFEKYEKNIHSLHNAEERMAHAIPALGIRLKTVNKPLIWDRKGTPPGTWNDIVGMRHIHGELDYAFKKKLIPPHYKYLEEEYLDSIYNYTLIKSYWDTGDRNILEDWWRK